jgi:hypothetical protein
VPLSTETIRVPEGTPVPYNAIPGAHDPVLTIVSFVEAVPAHAGSTRLVLGEARSGAELLTRTTLDASVEIGYAVILYSVP